MSETQSGNPPVKTHPDGAVRVKVWRNQTHEGKPFYNVTIGRAYQDRETGQWRESQSFGAADLLKLQPLLNEAYQTIRQEQALDRERAQQPQQPQLLDTPAPEVAPATGLEAQQQAAMANAAPAPAPEQGQAIQSNPARTPER